jgi:hypothetical protein
MSPPVVVAPPEMVRPVVAVPPPMVVEAKNGRDVIPRDDVAVGVYTPLELPTRS